MNSENLKLVEIGNLIKYGIKKFVFNEANLIKLMEKKKQKEGLSLQDKSGLARHKKTINQVKIIQGMVSEYFYSSKINLNYLTNNNISKTEKLNKLDSDIDKLKRCLKIGNKIKKARFSYTNLFDTDNINTIAEIAAPNVNIASSTILDVDDFTLNDIEVYNMRYDYIELIEISNSIIKLKLDKLKYEKHLLEKTKENKNQEINTKEIKNLKIYSPINFTNEVVDKERKNFKSIKLGNSYSEFSEQYIKSLELMDKFVNGSLNYDVINYMEKLKKSVANTIASYLDAKKTYNSFINDKSYDLNILMDFYKKAYKNFIKQLKKLPKEKRDDLIKKYNEKNEGYPFDIENFSPEQMLELANNIVIRKMIETKDYYIRTPNVDYRDDILEAQSLILERASYMSLEKVGEAYRRIQDECEKTPILYESYLYQLQQNFIGAIYLLMKKNKKINENQKLTTELKAEICLKYLKTPLIEKIIQKGKTK